jgi:hypothetical protein
VSVTTFPEMVAGPEITASETVSPELADGASVKGASVVEWPGIVARVIV